jgi:hypothetical protein
LSDAGAPLDLSAVYSLVPALVTADPEVSAAAFLGLPAAPAPDAPYFRAVLDALAAGSAHAVNYLCRTLPAWAPRPPRGALAAAVAAVRALPYVKARQVLPIVGAACADGGDDEAVPDAARAVAAFAGDGDAAAGAVAALALMWDLRIRTAGDASWFAEIVAGVVEEIEAADGANADAAHALLEAVEAQTGL